MSPPWIVISPWVRIGLDELLPMYVKSEEVLVLPSVKPARRTGVENLPKRQLPAVWALVKLVVDVTTPLVTVAGKIEKLPEVLTTVPHPPSHE